MARDHQLDAEAVVDQVVPGAAEGVGVRMVEQQPDDRGGQRLGVVGRDEQPGPPVLDHLGDAADVRGDDGPRQGHRLEDGQALRLAIGRQHGDIERGGHGGHVVAPAGEDDAVGDPQLTGLGFERLASRALRPTIRRYASGTLRSTCGHASSRVGWPFSGSSRATTPTSCEPGSMPYSSGSVQHASWWS